MHYPDTSLLVASLVTEARSESARNWLAEHAGSMLISDWTIAEFSSALALNARNGTILQVQRIAAAGWMRDLIVDTAAVLPVSRSSFHRAAALTALETSKLRASDALHLAVVEEHGAKLFTFDRIQAEAGAHAGISTHLL